jgi:hypothetical protein
MISRRRRSGTALGERCFGCRRASVNDRCARRPSFAGHPPPSARRRRRLLRASNRYPRRRRQDEDSPATYRALHHGVLRRRGGGARAGNMEAARVASDGLATRLHPSPRQCSTSSTSGANAVQDDTLGAKRSSPTYYDANGAREAQSSSGSEVRGSPPINSGSAVSVDGSTVSYMGSRWVNLPTSRRAHSRGNGSDDRQKGSGPHRRLLGEGRGLSARSTTISRACAPRGACGSCEVRGAARGSCDKREPS